MKQYNLLQQKAKIIDGVVYYDATNMSIGNVSMHCAMLLLKNIYPKIDKIIVENSNLIKNKYPKETVFIHTQSKFGNMKRFTFEDIMQRRPLYMIRRVVASMLPKNKTRNELIKTICI